MTRGPARGCANGCAASLALWALLILAIVTLGRVL